MVDLMTRKRVCDWLFSSLLNVFILLGPPLIGNGGTTDKYVWTQTLSEVEVHFRVAGHLRGKHFDVSISKSRLAVGVKGETPIVDGEMHSPVDTDECSWTLATEPDGGKLLTVLLTKQSGMTWWDCVIVGDPTIDTKSIEPENSKLDDLDADTRQTVEKVVV